MGTPRTFAERVAAMTLDEFESQTVFMVLLEALARPGSRQRLPEDLTARMPSTLIPLAALADVDVHVAVLDDIAESMSGEPTWEQVLVAATGSVRTDPHAAAMVAAPATADPTMLRTLGRGDALHPERGARLVLACSRLDDLDPDTADTVVTLSGPGVPGTRRLGIDGLSLEILEVLVGFGSQFPAGVDTWLVTTTGDLVGLARSTTIQVTTPTATHQWGGL